jgi:hypothetical protein
MYEGMTAGQLHSVKNGEGPWKVFQAPHFKRQ